MNGVRGTQNPAEGQDHGTPGCPTDSLGQVHHKMVLAEGVRLTDGTHLASPLTDFSSKQLHFFADLFILKGQGTTLYPALSPPCFPAAPAPQ